VSLIINIYTFVLHYFLKRSLIKRRTGLYLIMW